MSKLAPNECKALQASVRCFCWLNMTCRCGCCFRAALLSFLHQCHSICVTRVIQRRWIRSCRVQYSGRRKHANVGHGAIGYVRIYVNVTLHHFLLLSFELCVKLLTLLQHLVADMVICWLNDAGGVEVYDYTAIDMSTVQTHVADTKPPDGNLQRLSSCCLYVLSHHDELFLQPTLTDTGLYKKKGASQNGNVLSCTVQHNEM